jgi:hypothetical protein
MAADLNGEILIIKRYQEYKNLIALVTWAKENLTWQ